MLLKIIAALCMLLDHFAYIFNQYLPPTVYLACRIIGRLAFPAFAFLLVVGLRRSANPLKYALRIFYFALLSELCFLFTSAVLHVSTPSSVLITFFLSIVFLYGVDLIMSGAKKTTFLLKHREAVAGDFAPMHDVRRDAFTPQQRVTAGVLLCLFAVFLCNYIKPDYDFYGMLTVLLFYEYLPADERDFELLQRRRYSPVYVKIFVGFALLNLVVFCYYHYFMPNTGGLAGLQAFALLAVPLFPLAFTGKKPGSTVKYFFYFFYPLHYLILAIVFNMLS